MILIVDTGFQMNAYLETPLAQRLLGMASEVYWMNTFDRTGVTFYDRYETQGRVEIQNPLIGREGFVVLLSDLLGSAVEWGALGAELEKASPSMKVAVCGPEAVLRRSVRCQTSRSPGQAYRNRRKHVALALIHDDVSLVWALGWVAGEHEFYLESGVDVLTEAGEVDYSVAHIVHYFYCIPTEAPKWSLLAEDDPTRARTEALLARAADMEGQQREVVQHYERWYWNYCGLTDVEERLRQAVVSELAMKGQDTFVYKDLQETLLGLMAERGVDGPMNPLVLYYVLVGGIFRRVEKTESVGWKHPVLKELASSRC